MANNNPMAFPLSHETDFNQGMTLRDYFAAKAMQGLISNPAQYDNYLVNDWGIHEQRLSDMSYSIADAMLAERNKE